MNVTSSTLFIGNLPKDCSQQSLEQLLQPLGSIFEAQIVRDMNSSYGLINFTCEEAAREALKALDDVVFSGSKLRYVSFLLMKINY